MCPLGSISPLRPLYFTKSKIDIFFDTMKTNGWTSVSSAMFTSRRKYGVKMSLAEYLHKDCFMIILSCKFRIEKTKKELDYIIGVSLSSYYI